MFSAMNRLEILTKKTELRSKAEALLNASKAEARELNQDEMALFTEYRNQMDECDASIAKLDADLEAEKRVADQNEKKNNFTNKNMSTLVSQIRSAVEGTGDKKIELRAYSVTGDEGTKGGTAVETDVPTILLPLHDNPVLNQFTLLTGLEGNVNLPEMAAMNAAWKGESAKADATDSTFTPNTLSPKRLTTYCVVSRQLLFQTKANVEQILVDEIRNAVYQKLQATILGDGERSENQPGGLFNGASSMSVSFEDIVDLEKEVELANADVTGFIINPTVKATARRTVKADGQGGFLFENGELDGIPTHITNSCAGVLAGRLKDVYLCQWSDMHIVVDDVSMSDCDSIKVVVNAYFDCVKVRPNTVIAKTIGAGQSGSGDDQNGSDGE